MTTIVDTIADMRDAVAKKRAHGQRIALVPTMGALHAGHLALVELARKHSDCVVVSIFVNPLQFAAGEDLQRYPRTLKADMEALHAAQACYAFAPAAIEMYPLGFSTRLLAGGLGDILCGAARPGHFDGVGIVVSKLLNIVQPDFGVFGEKDFQQLTIIKRIVRDLNLPVEIVAGETVREADGLALSSRNQYLNAKQRQIAPILFAVLSETATAIRTGSDIAMTLQAATQSLVDNGFDSVDYLEYRAADTLLNLNAYQAGGRLLAAVRLGTTRLIDNIEVE